MNKRPSLGDSQDGMVSIIVTMIIMAVLSLIVVGFAQLARREQREALDKQLSSQAFYAAESGINDAVKEINDKNSPFANNKTTCDNASTPFNGTLSSTYKVSYTCLLINQTPETLEYSNIETDKSTTFPVKPVDPTDISKPVSLTSLNISWNRSDNGGSGYYVPATPASPQFPAVGSGGWGNVEAGVLRVDITSIDDRGFSRDDLVHDTFTVFLYPQSGSNTPSSVDFIRGDPDRDKQGQIKMVNCGTSVPPSFTRKCKVKITNLPGTVDRVKQFYVRLTSIYSSSIVTVSGDYSGGKALFTDAQYVIDSTGKANDVLKRIRVRKPARKADNDFPTYVLNSADSICKQLSVYPGSGKNDCP